MAANPGQAAFRDNKRPALLGEEEPAARAQAVATRGRITVPHTKPLSFREFSFNPRAIRDGGKAEIGAIGIAGASHPIYQFGSGGERVIGFDLQLEAEYIAAQKLTGRLTTSNAEIRLDLTEELQFYRALKMPTKYGQGFGNVAPPIVLFTYGSLYKGIPCVVKSVETRILAWTPDLLPKRATVSIELGEAPNTSIVAGDVSVFFHQR